MIDVAALLNYGSLSVYSNRYYEEIILRIDKIGNHIKYHIIMVVYKAVLM